MNKNMTLVIVGVASLVIGLVGGYFFRNYQLTKMRGNIAQGSPQRFNGQRQMFGERPIQGEILSIDEKGIIVKLPDGGSKIIIFTNSTQVNKSEITKKDNLKIDSKVTVIGPQNSDGSITANSVLLN